MGNIPKHVAIIMDGNGRWALARRRSRLAGHKAGMDAARRVVKYAGQTQIEVLTLFAFSSENWRRPLKEVQHILSLFFTALEYDINDLHKNNVQLRIIGDFTQFDKKLQQRIAVSQALTRDNTGLKLVIAANYGGQWDIIQATRRLAEQVRDGVLDVNAITAESLSAHLSLADLPLPDLFIRTSGEQRISNFYLWQLAYSELYFTDIYWPDFDEGEFQKALDYFSERERRFGATTEQVREVG